MKWKIFYFICSQMEGKDKVIRGQLSQLRSVLPTIKLHLAMCATIANATNKYDFLDLAYPLIDRLTAITHMGYPIRSDFYYQIYFHIPYYYNLAVQTSKIQTSVFPFKPERKIVKVFVTFSWNLPRWGDSGDWETLACFVTNFFPRSNIHEKLFRL